MRRQARLFALTEYLRGRRTGVTAEQLAERFGVTVRTIYRDLDALRDAALPVQADRGRGGGYALDKSYSLPPVNFTAREAAVLLAAGRYMTELRILPFVDTLASALDKVRGALTTSAQRELHALVARLQLIGVPAPRVEAAVRRAVERAWFEATPLFVRYRRSDGVLTERTIRVTGLVMERSLTLVECEDLGKGETRQLRLDRIEHACFIPAAQT
jgi:predicted DNA-binding transcriptional regulator YafY